MVGPPRVLGGLGRGVGTLPLLHVFRLSPVLSEGQARMAHVKVADRWEEGTPIPVTTDANIRAHPGGGKFNAFFTTVYVDDYLSIRVRNTLTITGPPLSHLPP